MIDSLLIDPKRKNQTPVPNIEKIAGSAFQLGSSGSDLGFHTRAKMTILHQGLWLKNKVFSLLLYPQCLGGGGSLPI